MSNKILLNAVHRALYGAAIISTAVGVAAQAQDEREVEEVITTGSRIPVDSNLVTTSPVTSLDASEIAYSGVTRVEDLVNDLPQVVPEFTANDSNGSTGTATLDLRGLGSERTLVLTNGHRMGFGDPYVLSPDINQIPGNLIERVEILTGGASSTYGSDAVSGVVNFIMKDDFEGFQIYTQKSGYQHDNDAGRAQEAIEASGFQQAPGDVTDGHTTDINVIVGMNSADGRGNVTGYLGWRDISSIRHSERDYSACALSSSNGSTCAGSATIPTGLFSPFNGTYYTVADGTNEFVPWDFTFFNYGPLNYFQRPDERYTGGIFANYDIHEKVNAYAEFQYMDDRSLAQIAPSGAFFVTSQINCSNAFLSTQQFNALGCTDPTDVVDYYIGRRNVEGGPRFDDIRHVSHRQLVGFRGDINEQWSYDAFVNFARLRFTEQYNNDLSITRIIRALDAVDDGAGGVTCQSVIDGSDPACVPWNIFDRTNLNPDGTSQAVTQGALNYIDLPLFSNANLEMSQGVAYVNGDLTNYGVKLPTANDGVQAVFGLEYRDETVEFDLDNGYNTGDAAGQGGATADVNGAVLVKEFFAEFKVPLVQGRPGVENLSLDLRYRSSDYDTGVDADTYNVGIEYSPTNEYKLRGGWSRAVRAPNINELFEPQTLGLWSGEDPCAGPTPALTEAECALTGVQPGQYGNIPLSPAGQYNATFGGNTQLEEETSDSFTVGIVLTPETWAQGLTLSLDYWNIDVDDAIAAGVGQEFTINECAAGNTALCPLINRGPNGNLWIGTVPFVQSTQINIGKFEVGGIDLTGSYGTEIGKHGLNFNLRGSYLTQWDDQPIPGGVTNDCVGFWGGDCERPRPEWKHTFATTWMTPREGLDVVMTWRMVGEVEEFRSQTESLPSRYTASDQHYFDLAASYSLEGIVLGGNTNITAGINNIMDEDPPFNGFFNNASFSNGNTVPGTWDPLGRYWFLGVTHSY